MPDQQPAAFDQWGIVEILGHKQYAGRITEQVIAGAAFVRVDIPEVVREGPYHGSRFEIAAHTKYFGPQSIYAMHPCSEEIARAAAQQIGQWNSPLPVEIPRRLMTGEASTGEQTVPASTTDVPADLEENDYGEEDDGIPFDGGSAEDPEPNVYGDEEEESVYGDVDEEDGEEQDSNVPPAGDDAAGDPNQPAGDPNDSRIGLWP